MPKYVLRALAAPVLINDITAYMVLISGQPVEVLAGSVNFGRLIGRKSQASFTVRTTTATHFQQYAQVLIYDQSNILVFSGYITVPNEQKPGFQPSLIHSLSCIGQEYLAEKRTYTATWTNKTCGFIVQDIVNTVLSQEGVTIGQIYDGPTPSPTLYPSSTLYPGGNVGLIPVANFSYAKVSAALDVLVQAASASGVPYYWMIDHLKRLWFVPYTAVVNPNVIDGTQIDQANNVPTVSRQNPTYRNAQIVTGGTAETLTQTETRKGDGNTVAWAMSFAISQVPTVTVNGASKTVGIKGVDTGKDFYWAKGDPILAQDSSVPKLTSSDTLQVVYVGQYPSVVMASNAAQIAYQASVDGTSGINEDVQNDATVTSVSSGLTLASELLTRYGIQGQSFQFFTRVAGYAPGQLVTVTIPDHDLINAQMLIENVVAGDQVDGYNIWYQITAIIGPYDTNWAAFFSKLLAHPQPANSINVGVSQAVTILQQMSLTYSVSMTATANVYACPLPSSSLFPSSSLYPC